MMHHEMIVHKIIELFCRNAELPYMTGSFPGHFYRFPEIPELSFVKHGNLVAGA